MRRHITYANAAATLALIFAMSGSALAANHYLIESTTQISPKVLKKLRGASGKKGATGATGSLGASGTAGASGKDGAAGKEGHEGKEGQRGPSDGFQAFNDSGGSVTENPTTVGTLALPAGSYLVTAKLWSRNEGTERDELECALANDLTTDADRIEDVLEPKGTTAWFGRAVVTLEAASTFASAGHWRLVCSAFDQPLTVSNVKIQAIQAASLSNTAT